MGERGPRGFSAQAWHGRHLFGVVPLFAIGTGALYPLIALELSSSGYGKSTIGAVTAAWFLGTFLGSALSGPVIGRLGYRLAFALAAGLAAVSVWGLNVSDSPLSWLVLRFLGGFGLGAYYLLMESWLCALATNATRGRMLAAYEALRIGAVALGPLVLIVASAHTAFALIGAVFVSAVIPMARAPLPTAEFDRVDWRAAFGIFACSPCTLTLVLIPGVIASSFYGLGAIYAESLGFTKTEIALFLSVTLVAPALSQMPIGTVADRYGRAPLCVLISSMAAAGAILLALGVPGTFLAVTATAAIVSSLSLPLYVLGISRLVDGGHPVIPAATAGLIGYNVGTFLGPFGAVVAMDHGGPAGLYAWVGFCLVLGLGAALLAMLQPRERCCPL